MKFRKIPVVIEAILFNGNNYEEIARFSKGKVHKNNREEMVIDTLEGQMRASVGDYIIRA